MPSQDTLIVSELPVKLLTGESALSTDSIVTVQSRTLVEFVECTEKAAGKSASGFFQILCLFSGSRYYALADDDEAAQTEHQHQSEGDRSPGFGNRGIVIDMHFEP